MVLLDLVKLNRKYQAILSFCLLYLSSLSRLVFIFVCRRFLIINIFPVKILPEITHRLCPSILLFQRPEISERYSSLNVNGNKESKSTEQEIKIPQYFLECYENVQNDDDPRFVKDWLFLFDTSNIE